MTALPREIPRFTKDLRQLWDDRGRPVLPEMSGRHDALVDARHNLAPVAGTGATGRPVSGGAFTGRLPGYRWFGPGAGDYSAQLSVSRAGDDGPVRRPAPGPATPPTISSEASRGQRQSRAKAGRTSTLCASVC
jgi:hypothetical protein